MTIRVSTPLAPLRSAQRAVGISNIAYARMKLKNTQLNWPSVRPNSAWMVVFMVPMQARSRYVTMASVTMKATTMNRV